MQNIIKLSAAIHELSWSQRKKTRTKTIQSFATAQTVAIINIILLLISLIWRKFE